MSRVQVKLRWERELNSETENLLMPDGERVYPPCELSFMQKMGGPHGQTPQAEFGWHARAYGMMKYFGDSLRAARSWVESNAKGEIEANCDGMGEVVFEEDQSHVNN